MSENDVGRMQTKSRPVSFANATKRVSATGKPVMRAPSSKPSAELQWYSKNWMAYLIGK